MQLAEAEKWMKDFYGKRGWTEYGPFIRVGFLMEEAGELARAVRAYEIGRDRPDEKQSTRAEQKQELIEEMGDVIGNIAILADMYDVSLEDVMKAHQDKLTKRFENA
ncbi:MazG-like family protein [Bacillus atrophaeus]|uniref:MazG-like family protein n=1 Tax=Bacillus atrophaeus TaxID=1452 RepID=UPI00227FDB6A|nr:MazG-like family protein [Bacillus atrophaeus]MCY8931586.1 MazG-like family protein [Bacillus atrophaeus]MCY8941822.1 MazG-like family protein [Bacillus atrophaeus]MCY8947396.1 MazG-like family protein [Bacillus atrophaeus]MCY9106414.1 MazG-like family protein [Bacillus atrophaeus]